MKTAFEQYLESASVYEQTYLKKEPAGKTAEALVRIMAEQNLSVAEAKGCLDYAKVLTDFKGKLRAEK